MDLFLRPQDLGLYGVLFGYLCDFIEEGPTLEELEMQAFGIHISLITYAEPLIY